MVKDEAADGHTHTQTHTWLRDTPGRCGHGRSRLRAWVSCVHHHAPSFHTFTYTHFTHPPWVYVCVSAGECGGIRDLGMWSHSPGVTNSFSAGRLGPQKIGPSSISDSLYCAPLTATPVFVCWLLCQCLASCKPHRPPHPHNLTRPPDRYELWMIYEVSPQLVD